MKRELCLQSAILAILCAAPLATSAAPTSSKPPTAAKGAAAIQAAATMKPTQKVDGYLLKQKLEYHGALNIKASKFGSLIQTKDLHLYVLPNRDLVVINDTNKTKALVNRGVWLNTKAIDALTEPVTPAMVKKKKIPLKKPKMIAGHLCDQHWAVCYRGNKQFWFYWEYWTARDIKLPQELLDDYLALVHLPSGAGFPLHALRHSVQDLSRAHSTMEFLTTSEAKPIKFTFAELSPPTKGYRSVEDEMDIVLGQDEDDEITSLMRNNKQKRFRPR